MHFIFSSNSYEIRTSPSSQFKRYTLLRKTKILNDMLKVKCSKVKLILKTNMYFWNEVNENEKVINENVTSKKYYLLSN